MPIELYPNIAKVKRNGVYQNLPGFVQQSGDADIEAMIARKETSTTAQYAHPINSFFILNDVLYQADEDIAVNGTIAVGTNCHVAIIGDNIKNLEDKTSELNAQVFTFHNFGNWTKGSLNANGPITASGNGACSSLEDYHNYSKIISENGSRFTLAFYNSSKTYIGKVSANGSINKVTGDWKFFTGEINVSDYATEATKYFAVCLLPTDGTTLTTDTFKTWANNHCKFGISQIALLTSYVGEPTSLVSLGDLEQGGFTASGLNSDTTEERVRSKNYFPVVGGSKYRVHVVSTGAKAIAFSVSFYTKNDFTTNRLSATDWVANQGEITCPDSAKFGRLLMKFSDGTTFAPTDISALTLISEMSIFEQIELIEKPKAFTNYLIGADFAKKEITLSKIGDLKYGQAFCKYANYYYSIDGSNIAKQDSDFALSQDVSLSTGHGNSLQLGSNGIAYASGWNNNNVYAIDLATLSITDTISLPTTGYTTVAIDDLNKIAYIFQRSTTPSTEDYYNFIVYDYDNEQIISTKVFCRKYAAMQACDYYDGRIIFAYGLGTNVAPNGFVICNTVGDIISEIKLNDFSATEPEGICIDRVTNDILISFANKKLFKFSN